MTLPSSHLFTHSSIKTQRKYTPSPPMEPRQRDRDLWMTYIAQTILGKKPDAYPNIGSISDKDDGHLPSYHRLSFKRKKEIRTEVQKHLPCSVNRILKLCTEKQQICSPYDFVLCADQEIDASDKRIAKVVCDEMFATYDTLNVEQHNAQGTTRDSTRMYLFSLRRALVRFCKESKFWPESLFLEDVTLPEKPRRGGAGGFADVWIGTHSSRGSLAFKTFRAVENSVSNTEQVRALVVEAVMLSRLSHKNLLQFMGLYRRPYEGNDAVPYIVTPWMKHGDILNCTEVLEMQGKAVPRMRWIYEVSCGLRYLHDECIVHGDLHKGNILIDDDMHVKIVDFGLSTFVEPTTSATITRLTNVAATKWSAPELLSEGEMPTFASDVWAFGCACLLIWTGKGPYTSCNTLLQFQRVLDQQMRSPEDPHNTMDTFPKDSPEEQSRGITLRVKVALPCWSYVVKSRPSMEEVERTLRESFENIDIK